MENVCKVQPNKPYRIEPERVSEQYEYMDKVASLIGSGKKAHVRTYGCQQNEADSERIAGMAQRMGYTITDDVEEADLIVINTCAVREHAELKALSITGQYKHLKAAKPELIICMCGCMASQERRKEDVKRKYPYVDIVFSTDHLWCFPQILFEKLKKGKRLFYSGEAVVGNIAEGLPLRRESLSQAWLSVMYGCNNFCSYCIVPYVRGRERSRKFDDVMAEAKEIASAGYKEITLLGQNVNSYGKDLCENVDFADILDAVCALDGDFVVRFMTSHPKDATKKLIDTIARNEKAAKHFHLPLQSGSDEILRRMNRVYNRETYLSLISYMREKMPDISITTDIIVGFPGETEEQFEDTLDMLRRVEYDNIYSFIYSPRPGTPAALYPDQVDEKVKTVRFGRMLELQQGISKKKNEALIGKTLRVLVEGRSKTDQTKLSGRTDGNRLVHFEGDDALIGKFAKTTIESADTYSLHGRIVK